MLPKNPVIGVHHDGAGMGLRDSSASWCKARAHSGGGAGPRVRLATTSEVSTSNEFRRHSASFDWGKCWSLTDTPCPTNLPNFGHGYHHNGPGAFVVGRHAGDAQNGQPMVRR